MLESLHNFQDIALLLARVFLGVMFITHGKGKFLGPKPGILGFSNWLRSEGVPLPVLGAIAVATTEFLGGIAMVLGLFTELVAILMACVMLVAIRVNIKDGKKFRDGWELDLMILSLAILFMTFGAGQYSLDHWFSI